MDVNLNGPMDGVEAARLITQYKNVPIIFVSAYKHLVGQDLGMKNAKYDFMAKPFVERDLLSKINDFLNA